jgi:hypothetical protein
MFKHQFVNCRDELFSKLQSKKTKILTLDYVPTLLKIFRPGHIPKKLSEIAEHWEPFSINISPAFFIQTCYLPAMKKPSEGTASEPSISACNQPSEG